MKVEQHPTFTQQFEQLLQADDIEVAGEVAILVDALEEHRHDMEGEATDDPSHPVVTSRFQLFALRRTPPTIYTPYADRPPAIRILYVWFLDVDAGEEVAVVMLMGDKTALGNHWYHVRSRPSRRSSYRSGRSTIPATGRERGEADDKPSIPEPVFEGYSAEDFATSTQRYKALRAELLKNPRAKAAYDALSEQIAERMEAKTATLGELRRALGLTQAQLAEMLDLGQGDISRLERRRNLYLNTLARFVEATGGRLRITAIYGDTEVTLDLRDAETSGDPEQAEGTAAIRS